MTQDPTTEPVCPCCGAPILNDGSMGFDEARATAPAGLDVPLLTRSLAVVRARGEAFALSGQHVHWTDAEVAAMVADVYAELAALAASGETEQDR